ncbi:MAG: PadR family transcriptional regulator [Gammaproteobacteria bacterium]|nr:PadR family transcriptional regulator [Gammaproteobacteria bacterium]
MTTRRQRALSELEGVCLGIIYKYDACTAYRVRQELKEAPSSHWQASAGSVYPLLKRLEDDGFLKSSADKSDGRGRKTISISRQGRQALNSWILSGTDQAHISSVTDPIRSRMFFLAALPKAQRRMYLDQVTAETKRYLRETRQRLDARENPADLYDYLGALGAVKLTEARLDWLLTVQSTLVDEFE